MNYITPDKGVTNPMNFNRVALGGGIKQKVTRRLMYTVSEQIVASRAQIREKSSTTKAEGQILVEGGPHHA